MAISLLLVLALLVVLSDLRAYDEVAPLARVTDARSLLLEMPRPEAVYELHLGDSRFTEFVGPLPSAFLALPSGPPAYVFDESDHLVDWSCDTGDAPEFTRQWHTNAERRRLGEAESRRLIEETTDSRHY
jgi:hypothetical protein